MKRNAALVALLLLGIGLFAPAQLNVSQPSPVNQTQVNGIAVSTGNGVSGTGVQRVTVASDNTPFAVNATLQTGANAIGALTANQSVNQTQVNGIAVATGNGVTGTGVQRVTISSDNTAFTVNAAESGTWTVQPGNTANTTPWLTQFPASSSAVITTATTTAAKATAGTLRRIVVGTQVASATIKLFNVASASCTGTPGSGAAGVITLPSTLGNPFTLEFNQSFSAGICVVTSGATNINVIFD